MVCFAYFPLDFLVVGIFICQTTTHDTGKKLSYVCYRNPGCMNVLRLNIFSCVFSQLRAQNQVLKKAVVDEQANSVSLKVNWWIKQEK